MVDGDIYLCWDCNEYIEVGFYTEEMSSDPKYITKKIETK